MESFVNSEIAKQISEEHSQISIETTHRDLRAVKTMMGPVTVVWYDYIIWSAETAKVGELVKFAEHDIRRAVKKDKNEICYAVIAGYWGLKQGELKDYAIIYAEKLGLDFRTLEELSRLDTETAILEIMRYILPDEIKKLLPPKNDRVVYFKRFARKRLEDICQRLETAMNQFDYVIKILTAEKGRREEHAGQVV